MNSINKMNNEIAQGEVGKLIFKSTCQFYNFKKGTTEIPVPNGCGVLFQHNENYFCFSNAHVLADEYLSMTFIILEGGRNMTLGGKYYYSKIPSSGRKDDPLDIAVVHLESVTVHKLLERKYKFLDISHILTGCNPNKSENVFATGYPGSQTKIKIKSKTIIPIPFFLKTTLYSNKSDILGFRKDFHFIAKYSRSKIFDSKSRSIKLGPKPYGISGSGMWIIRSDSDGKHEPYLIGILSEYLENRALLVSTKIDLFIDIIRQLIDPEIPNIGIQVDLKGL